MKKPKKCTLCEKKLKNPLVVSNNIYGDKKKSKAFYHCTYCDVRFMYPRLTLFQEKYFYKKEFESFMNKRSGKLSGWLSAKKHVANNKETFQRIRDPKRIAMKYFYSGWMIADFVATFPF